MGAGRKTFTYDFDTRNETNYRFEQQQKNLGNQLGGAIFMCNSRTYHTCIESMMFGLPSPHWCYVQYITAGMPLFLYNFETKELHGIFKAASNGDWEIDPLAWTDGSRRTPYPCQVQVELYMACPPLPADQFRGVIADNFIGNTDKFQQELSKKQAAELCALFRRKAEGQHGGAAAAQRAAGSWPSLGAGSSAQVAASAAAAQSQQQAQQAAAGRPLSSAANVWHGRGAAAVGGGSNDSGQADMETEPSGLPSLGGKTFAQLQAEEERRVKKAAKLAAKQAASSQPAAAGAAAPAQLPPSGQGAGASSNGASTSAAAAAAAANRAVVQQASAASARPAAAQQPQVQQAPQQQQQQQQGAASSAASTAAAIIKPGVELLGDELTALKGTLRPLIDNMLALKMESEVRVAAAVQAHLSRLDDQLTKVQKERGQAVMESQRLAARVAQLEQEAAALRQALKLSMQGGATTAPTAAPTAAATQRAPSAAAAVPAASAPAAVVAAAPPRPGSAAATGRTSPQQRGEELYFLGGNDQGNTAAAEAGGWLDSVLIYCPATDSWREGPAMPLRRGYGSSGVLGRQLYVMGGGNSHEWLADCRRLDLATGRWEAAPAMSTLRGCAGVAVLGGRLYVAGGGVADAQYDTVEIFNPEINAWMPGPRLRSKRFSTAAATLDGCIYVAGGYDGSYLQSAERLDPREGKWQLIGDMHEKRGAHACSQGPGGCIYVLGGYDVNNTDPFMSTVEAYDPRMGKWLPKGGMQQGRAYSAATYSAGSLWVLGGMSGDNYNETFERYDAATNRWVTVTLPSNVSTNRAFLSAAVVPPL